MSWSKLDLFYGYITVMFPTFLGSWMNWLVHPASHVKFSFWLVLKVSNLVAPTLKLALFWIRVISLETEHGSFSLNWSWLLCWVLFYCTWMQLIELFVVYLISCDPSNLNFSLVFVSCGIYLLYQNFQLLVTIRRWYLHQGLNLGMC